jgi:hypothetical protein
MPLSVRDSTATLRAVLPVAVRDTAGVLRQVTEARVRDGAAVLRTFYTSLPAFRATAAPASINATLSPSPTCTVTVVGGVAPFTYLWAQVSGDADWEAVFEASPSTSFGYSGGEIISNGVFACTVTDSNSLTALSSTVHVHYRDYIGGLD